MILPNPSESFLLWHQRNKSVERCPGTDFVHQPPWCCINWPINCMHSCIFPSLFLAHCIFCQWSNLLDDANLSGFELSKSSIKPYYNADTHFMLLLTETWCCVKVIRWFWSSQWTGRTKRMPQNLSFPAYHGDINSNLKLFGTAYHRTIKQWATS